MRMIGAFLIDRGGVEIVYFHISVWPDIMRERPRVLGELLRARRKGIVDYRPESSKTSGIDA